MKQHAYNITMTWTGNEGHGTETYQGYRRDFTVLSAGKAIIDGSSDPCFRGDARRYNPEEMLVASLSSCHMLWYLHLCSANGISVLGYTDDAIGTMEEDREGSGQFVRVLLRPIATIAPDGDMAKAISLHEDAHRHCFIARSVNFPVECEPKVLPGEPVQSVADV